MTWDSGWFHGLHWRRAKYFDLALDQQPFFMAQCSIEMICAIPMELVDPKNDTVRIALIESWYINARSLIDFLGLGTSTRRNSDFEAQKLTSWRPTNIDAEKWGLLRADASKLVAHFSHKRLVTSCDDLGTKHASPNELAKQAMDLVHVCEDLANFLDNSTHAARGSIRLAVMQGRERLAPFL